MGASGSTGFGTDAYKKRVTAEDTRDYQRLMAIPDPGKRIAAIDRILKKETAQVRKLQTLNIKMDQSISARSKAIEDQIRTLQQQSMKLGLKSSSRKATINQANSHKKRIENLRMSTLQSLLR